MTGGAATSALFTLTDEAATAALAAALAERLETGDVVTLHGPLGVGKTALARAMIRALTDNPEEEVPSPTFTLVQTYETPRGTLWHMDLYRLTGPDAVIELGWEEARAGGLILVEWPDRLGALLPAERLEIHLSLPPDALEGGLAESKRSLRLVGTLRWGARLAAAESAFAAAVTVTVTEGEPS